MHEDILMSANNNFKEGFTIISRDEAQDEDLKYIFLWFLSWFFFQFVLQRAKKVHFLE